jgi:hypothetical protein
MQPGQHLLGAVGGLAPTREVIAQSLAGLLRQQVQQIVHRIQAHSSISVGAIAPHCAAPDTAENGGPGLIPPNNQFNLTGL